MENKLRYVYLITNTINLKTYIGKHTKGKNEDINSKTYMGSGKIIKQAIQKYGIINFSKQILYYACVSQDEILEVERYYITLYKNNGKAEYNILLNSGKGSSGFKFSIESKIKQSTSIKAFYLKNPDKIRRRYKEDNGFYRKKHSEKTKQINREKHYYNKNRSKSIYCFEKDEIYLDAETASHILNVSSSNIRLNCKGLIEHVCGLHFKYVDDKDFHIGEYKKQPSIVMHKNSKHSLYAQSCRWWTNEKDEKFCKNQPGCDYRLGRLRKKN